YDGLAHTPENGVRGFRPPRHRRRHGGLRGHVRIQVYRVLDSVPKIPGPIGCMGFRFYGMLPDQSAFAPENLTTFAYLSVSSATNLRNSATVIGIGFEHTLPAVGAVDVAGAQNAAFQVAELVKYVLDVARGWFTLAEQVAWLDSERASSERNDKQGIGRL